MCLNCEMTQKKVKDHFDSEKELEGMLDNLRDGILERAVKAVLEGKKKVSGGKGLSIFYKVDTLKGKRDVELDVEFIIKSKRDEMSVEFHLDDINFHKVGTLTDSTIDNISGYIERGAEQLGSAGDLTLINPK